MDDNELKMKSSKINRVNLGLFINGGNEIGKKVEAEKGLRRLLSSGGDYGFELSYQDTKTRERHILPHVGLHHCRM